MNHKQKRVLALRLFIFATLFFIIYLYLSNNITTKKLYPWEPDWYRLDISKYGHAEDCLTSHELYIKFDQIKKFIYIPMSFYKMCDNFTTEIAIGASDYSRIVLEANSSYVTTTTIKNNTRLKLDINTSKMRDSSGRIDIYIMMNKSFFNYYDISSWNIDVRQVDFILDTGLNGYEFDESSFYVLEGQLTRDEPLWRGLKKEFGFSGEGRKLIRFSPKSKRWVVALTLLDVVVLSFVAVMLYEILNIFLFRGEDIRIDTDNARCLNCGNTWNKKPSTQKCYKCNSTDIEELRR